MTQKKMILLVIEDGEREELTRNSKEKDWRIFSHKIAKC
jgi:hypothetical protein